MDGMLQTSLGAMKLIRDGSVSGEFGNFGLAQEDYELFVGRDRKSVV